MIFFGVELEQTWTGDNLIESGASMGLPEFRECLCNASHANAFAYRIQGDPKGVEGPQEGGGESAKGGRGACPSHCCSRRWPRLCRQWPCPWLPARRPVSSTPSYRLPTRCPSPRSIPSSIRRCTTAARVRQQSYLVLRLPGFALRRSKPDV